MPTKTAPKPTTTRRKPAAKAAPPVETPDPIRAKDLAATLADALLFAGKDWTLPVIASVRLEADGSKLTAVATDRYCLGIRTVALPSDPFDFLLSRDDARDLIGLLRTRPDTHKRGPEATLTVDSDVLTVRCGTLTVQYSRAIGEFPVWRKLVERMRAYEVQSDVGTVALNATYLARFAKVSGIAPGSPLTVTTTGRSHAIRFTVGQDFEGFQMPLRLSEQPDEVAA